MYVFGPVPSRRLGRGLGINRIPPKTCPYACIYCQVGQTTSMAHTRQHFYDPDAVITAVQARVTQLQTAKELLDYLTLVPDGEHTLDIRLGALITGLRPLGIPIAVISMVRCLTNRSCAPTWPWPIGYRSR